MGRKNKSKKKDDNTRTYFKVLATFKCSKDTCGKEWKSAHGWTREKMEGEGGIECESCGNNAELKNAVDEMLKLDCYNCPNVACQGNGWQAIHTDKGSLAQECDLCGRSVLPEKNPQERFGRHYWFECVNPKCQNPQVWEDFSVNAQKTQRCTRCQSSGNISKVQKLKPLPPWKFKNRRDGEGGKPGDPDRKGRPSTHVAEYCDMCQDLKRQGKANSCHAYRKVQMQLATAGDGQVQEVIVGISHAY